MQKSSNKGGHQSFKTNGSVIPANLLSVVNLKLFFLAEKKEQKTKQKLSHVMPAV